MPARLPTLLASLAGERHLYTCAESTAWLCVVMDVCHSPWLRQLHYLHCEYAHKGTTRTVYLTERCIVK